MIELLVIIGRVVLAIVPVKAQPLDVVLDRVDVLDVFLDRIGVVEAQVAVAAELVGDAEVEADRLGVPDVQVAVRFRWKARDHTAAVFSGGHIGGDDLANKILSAFAAGGRFGGRCGRIFLRHGSQSFSLSDDHQAC